MKTRPDRRVLLLNGTQPLGAAIIRQLMPTSARVTSVFPTDGESYLPGVQLQRGPLSLPRLRSLLAVGEFDLIIHHAETRADIELTHDLLTFVRQPTDIILALPLTSRVTITPRTAAPIRLGLVRLPELFGPNLRDTQSWLSRAFTAAASGRSVPRPTDSDAPVVYVEDAATSILAAADRLADSTTTLTDYSTLCTTRGQVYQSLTAETDPSHAIAMTLAWYHQHPPIETQDESLGRAA